MAGEALEILKMSFFYERGYIHKENQRCGPSCPKVRGGASAPQPLPLCGPCQWCHIMGGVSAYLSEHSVTEED